MGQNQSQGGSTTFSQQMDFQDSETFNMNIDDFNTMNRHNLFLHHPNGSQTSVDSYLNSPSSITSGESSYDSSSDIYSPVTADGFFPQFSEDWAMMFPPAEQFIQPEPVAVEPVAPPAPKRKFKPCDCMYCTPMRVETNTEKKTDAASPSSVTINSSPNFQVQMQVETAPRPIIVGQHALGSDIALLQQQMQIQHARKLVKTNSLGRAAARPQPASQQYTGYDGFDGRPFYGDALTYL